MVTKRTSPKKSDRNDYNRKKKSKPVEQIVVEETDEAAAAAAAIAALGGGGVHEEIVIEDGVVATPEPVGESHSIVHVHGVGRTDTPSSFLSLQDDVVQGLLGLGQGQGEESATF